MLKDAGAAAVIVGHSERRADHGERDARREGQGAGGAPRRPDGDRLHRRDRGRAPRGPDAGGGRTPARRPRCRTRRRRDDTVVAYEPVWAIGTGLTPTVADVAEVHGFLRRTLAERLGAEGKAMRILYGGSVKPDNARELMARRRRQRRAGRRREPQSQRLSCHHRGLRRLTVAPEKGLVPKRLACPQRSGDGRTSMTRSGLSLVIAALLLQAPAARAAQLDKDSCAKLKTEQAPARAGRHARQHGQGPGVGQGQPGTRQARADPPADRGGRAIAVPLRRPAAGAAAQGDPDPAAREVESPKGPPPRPAKPPQAVKKAPDAEKKKVAPPNKASALPRRSGLQGSSAGECGAISCGCCRRGPCQGSRPGGACPPAGDRRGDPGVEHNAAAGSRPGRIASAAAVQGRRGQEGGGHQGRQGQGEEEGRGSQQGRELRLVLQSLCRPGTAGQEVTGRRTALAEGPRAGVKASPRSLTHKKSTSGRLAMITVLLILHLMIAASLVGVVLLQRSEGGALGIGGGGGGFMSGRGAANFLTRVTAGLAAAFFATSILLTLLATRTERAPSVFDTPASSVPAKSAAGGAGPRAASPARRSRAAPRGGVLDKLSPPAPSGPRVPQSQ